MPQNLAIKAEGLVAPEKITPQFRKVSIEPFFSDLNADSPELKSVGSLDARGLQSELFEAASNGAFGHIIPAEHRIGAEQASFDEASALKTYNTVEKPTIESLAQAVEELQNQASNSHGDKLAKSRLGYVVAGVSLLSAVTGSSDLLQVAIPLVVGISCINDSLKCQAASENSPNKPSSFLKSTL